MLITNMASDNSLPDVNKDNATSPYSDFNDYGDYKDFSNPQLKDHIDKGFAYTLSGDNKDFSIPLLGDQSRDHTDSGFVNPLSGDTGFAIPLLGDQEDFSNPYPGDDKDSFIASKLPNDRMGFVNTLSNLGDEGENCSEYSRKLSEDCPQLQSGEDKFSPERFIYEAGCALQYTNRPPSRHNKGDRPQCDGFFIDGFTRFPAVGGSAAMKNSHNSAQFNGKAFPKSLENILKKIDNITDPRTCTGGSQCLEDEKSLDRFRNENTKDNQLKSRRSIIRIQSRRDVESKQPYARNINKFAFSPPTNLRGRERQSGGMEIRDRRKYQGMSYLKCQITTADHKICPKGFSFWYEVLPHMYYSHMERLYQLSVNNSTIALSCPYNDPDLGIWCESKFATSQPYDCDKPFNEQLAQALFCLTNHIEELHNGRSSSDQCPVCKDDLLVRPYIGREMAQFWIHLVTHLPEFLALPPGSIPGKPIKLSVRGDLHCVCDYHFESGHDYVSHIVNHHTADIQAAAASDGWVKLNCPAAETCRFETRRVPDVEGEVELGLAYSQLVDHIREWHATGKNVCAPFHHCPTCLVSTKAMPDHVVWRHVARHEDLGAYFCRPCQVFVVRRAMENHLVNCLALKALKVGGKGDVKERLLQLSGSVHLPATSRIAAQIEQKMPPREMGNRLPAVEMGNRLPALEMGNRLPAMEMGNRLPAVEMGNRHRPSAGEMEHRMRAEDMEHGERKNRMPAGEMGHRMHPREMRNRWPLEDMEYSHRLPVGEIENSHRMPIGEMEYSHRLPVGDMEYSHRLPVGEMEYSHRLPVGEMESSHRLQVGEMEYHHRMPVGEMEYRHRLPVGEMEQRMPVGEMEYSHRLPVGEMEYSHRLQVGEMEYRHRLPVGEMEQRMSAGAILHRLPLGEMKNRMPVGEMDNKLSVGEMNQKRATGDNKERKRILKINTYNIWDETTLHSRWEMADPEGQHLMGRDAEKRFGIEGTSCTVRRNLESKNPLEMHQNRPEDNYGFNQSVEDSSMVKAQFELQYPSSKDYNNQSSVEKDFNQNVKLSIEEPELGWGDFSNLDKPESLKRFQAVENHQSQLVENPQSQLVENPQSQPVKSNFNDDVKPPYLDEVKPVKVANQEEPAMLDNVGHSIHGRLGSTSGHKNLFNAFTKKEDEVTNLKKIIQVKSDDLHETYIIPQGSKLAEQNDVNEASPVQVIEHKKIKVTLLNREKATELDNNPGGSSPTISSTFTQDTSSTFTQDTCGDTSPKISSTLMQDTCGETKSSQETCKDGTEVLKKQSVKQFSCDVCGTKFMKEHILNFHRAIHKK